MEISSVNSDLIRGNVTAIILKSLYVEDRYGYDILREIEVKSEGHYKIKQPTLYSCLKRLEKQGLISSYWGSQSDTEGGRRRYYSLTEKGRNYVEQMQSEYEYSRTILDKLLSDEEFDLDSGSTPFDINSLRPYTKRQTNTENDNPKSSSDIKDNRKLKLSEKNADINKVQIVEKNQKNAQDIIQTNEDIELEVADINNSEIDENKFNDENDNADNLKIAYDVKGSSYDTAYHSTTSTIDNLVSHNIIDKNDSTSDQKEIDNNIEPKTTVNSTQSVYENDSSSINLQHQDKYYRPEKLVMAESTVENLPRTIVVSEEKRLQKDEACRTLGIGKYSNSVQIDIEEWENAQKKSGFTEETEIKEVIINQSINNSGSYQNNNFSSDFKNESMKNKSNDFAVSSNLNLININNTNDKSETVSTASFSFKKDNSNNRNYFDVFSDLRKSPDAEKNVKENSSGSTDKSFVQRPASNIDLKTKLFGAGYKVRPYSRENIENYYSLNFLHSNKINRDCYAIMYLVLIIELIIGKLIFKDKYQGISYILIGVIGILIPTIPFIVYSFRPDKRIRANFSFKTSILNRLMLFLNLVVIVCLVGFFAFGANINEGHTMLTPILIPILLLLNVPLSSVIYLILYNTKRYHIS